MICDKCYGKGITHHYEKGMMEVQQCDCVKNEKNDSFKRYMDKLIEKYAKSYNLSYAVANEQIRGVKSE